MIKYFLIILLFNVSIISLAKASDTEFKFIKSEAVRFAKIAIKGENCDTVLELIFDESDGLGTGFDTLYILKNKDVDINGSNLNRNKIRIKSKKGFSTKRIPLSNFKRKKIEIKPHQQKRI